MKNVNKAFRLLSVVLAVMMVLTAVPTAFASDSGAAVQNATTGATYDDLNTALAAASNGDTIKLLADFDDSASGTTVIGADKVFDLNGKKLTALQFLSFGDVIDTSADSVGGVVISNDITEAYTMLQPENPYLPLYDEANGCYRFYAYEAKCLGYSENLEKDTVKFGFVIRITGKSAYQLLAADASDFKMQINLSVVGNSGTPDQEYTYTCDSSLLKTYAAAIYKNYDVFASGKNVSLTFSISGILRMNKGTEISATPVMTSPATRVTKEGNTRQYVKTAEKVEE